MRWTPHVTHVGDCPALEASECVTLGHGDLRQLQENGPRSESRVELRNKTDTPWASADSQRGFLIPDSLGRSHPQPPWPGAGSAGGGEESDPTPGSPVNEHKTAAPST